MQERFGNFSTLKLHRHLIFFHRHLNWGPYKSALIAALHRPLRIAAIDDGATIDEAAAPHDVLIEKLKKFTIQPSKVNTHTHTS